MLTLKKIALGIALTSAVVAAKAQKTYTEGILNYDISVMGQNTTAKSYFKGDTTTFEFMQGPASIKMLRNIKTDYFAILIDVPVASMKKAVVATPADMEQAKDMQPSFKITPTGDTKKILDYNCKKYIAKEEKSGKSYDLWVTTDIAMAPNVLTDDFMAAPGVPVQFTHVQSMGGKTVEELVTINSIKEMSVPSSTFQVPSSFDRITMDQLNAMSGGRK